MTATGVALRVAEVTRSADLAPHLAAWRRLAERAPSAELFETPLWVTAWLETFWGDRPLAFLFVYDADRLVGLAPLLDDQEGSIGCPGSLVTPVNPHARRCCLLHEGDPALVLEAVVAYLEENRRAWRMRLRCADATAPAVAAIRDRRPLALERDGGDTPVIRMGEGWDAYWAGRPRQVRRELERKQKRLTAAWEAEFLSLADPAEQEAALADVLRIESRSWKEPVGTSIGSEPGAADFYWRLAGGGAAEGWLRVELLYLNGEPAAHICGMVRRGVYYALKTSYDQAYRAWSPGVVLFHRVIRRSFAEGLDTFDFLGAESRWKCELGNAVRAHVDACLFADGALRCRWDRVRETRVKPFVHRRAPLLVDLRRRFRSRTAAPRTGR
jgi:CelD/BcsL family acetyltransferase involved in cellulose biosynthesis